MKSILYFKEKLNIYKVYQQIKLINILYQNLYQHSLQYSFYLDPIHQYMYQLCILISFITTVMSVSLTSQTIVHKIKSINHIQKIIQSGQDDKVIKLCQPYSYWDQITSRCIQCQFDDIYDYKQAMCIKNNDIQIQSHKSKLKKENHEQQQNDQQINQIQKVTTKNKINNQTQEGIIQIQNKKYVNYVRHETDAQYKCIQNEIILKNLDTQNVQCKCLRPFTLMDFDDGTRRCNCLEKHHYQEQTNQCRFNKYYIRQNQSSYEFVFSLDVILIFLLVEEIVSWVSSKCNDFEPNKSIIETNLGKMLSDKEGLVKGITNFVLLLIIGVPHLRIKSQLKGYDLDQQSCQVLRYNFKVLQILHTIAAIQYFVYFMLAFINARKESSNYEKKRWDFIKTDLFEAVKYGVILILAIICCVKCSNLKQHHCDFV